jgi:hypothetical protein
MIGYISSYVLLDRTDMVTYKLGKKSVRSRALDLVINDSFDIYNKLGIKVIETDIDTDIDHIALQAKGYGYELVSGENLVATQLVEDILITEFYSSVCVQAVDLESEWDNVIDFILTKENHSLAALDQFFTFIKNDKKRIISHTIIKRDGEIIAHGLLIRSRWDEKVAMMSFFHAEEGNSTEYKDLIMSKIVQDAWKKGIEAIEVQLRDDVTDFQDNYLRYGFIFNKMSTFQKVDERMY